MITIIPLAVDHGSFSIIIPSKLGSQNLNIHDKLELIDKLCGQDRFQKMINKIILTAYFLMRGKDAQKAKPRKPFRPPLVFKYIYRLRGS